MGRPTSGWKLRRPEGQRFWSVRFTAHGRQVERSTGEESEELAAKRAELIYAEEIRTPRPRRAKVAKGSRSIVDAAVDWLTDEEPLRDETTNETYALYARTHWDPFFESVAGLTARRVEEYRAERLRRVSASTVGKELGALRAFARWLGLEVAVPGVPARATGVRDERWWKGTQEFSPDEVRRVLDALTSPARERYELGYETSLRPETIDGLSVPEHWRPGSTKLEIPREIDKARNGRPVPLSAKAVAALERAHAAAVERRRQAGAADPEAGKIFFSRHRRHVKTVARSVIEGERGKRFAPMDLRASRITHWLESSGNLPGTQYLAGHARATTTARYAKPSLRAAEDVLGEFEGKTRRRPGNWRRERRKKRGE